MYGRLPWMKNSPWMRIQLDFTGPYLGKMFLIISGSHSKWLDITPMNSINSISLTRLTKSFSTPGLPFIIVTDVSKSKLFNKKDGTKHIFKLPLITHCSME